MSRAVAVLIAVASLSGTPAQTPDPALIQRQIAEANDLMRRNQNAEAAMLLERLVDARLDSDPKLAADVYHALGTAYYRLTKYAEATRYYQRALASAQATGDRPSQARTMLRLAYVYKNTAAYAKGLASAEQALALYQALSASRDAASAWVVIGAIHDSMGDHRRALDSFTRALPLYGDEQSADVVTLLFETGISYKNIGDYTEALRHYSRALDMAAAIKDTSGRIFVFGNLGVLYATLGEHDRALEYFQEARRLSRDVGNRRIESLSLLAIGESYWELGNRERALESLQQEVKLSRELGGRTEEALALKNLGDIYAATGDESQARVHYGEALRIQREIGERRHVGFTLVGLTDLARRAGHVEEAITLGEEAVAIARETDRPDLEWDARRALAQAAAAAGRTAQAIDELWASAHVINDLRAGLASDRSKIAYVDRRQEVFNTLASLLVKAGRAGEALEAVEAGRARALADLLEQRQIVGKPPERAALAAVRLAQANLHQAPDTARTLDALESTLSALSAESPELASLLTADSPTLMDIVATTKRLDATLVEYLVTPEALLVWVVDREGAIHSVRVDVPRSRLDELTKRLRESLDRSASGLRTASAALDAPLRELHRFLLSPLAAWLPKSSEALVLIVPHDVLALVPFAALQDEKGRPLIERYVLSYAPAASVYAYTAQKLRTASKRMRGAMIVADPVPPAESGTDRLPFAREEGRLVATHLRDTPVRLLAAKDASESAVKREASQYTILHFATHGLVAPERPLASSLLLGAGDGEDGYLRVDEIFNLDLAAEIVVLSGCSTGLGRLSGDGIIGLTRAFLYAGTPTVVVSQWKVSDRATALLMDRFYAGLRRGLGKARALRAAALATRKQFPHPAQWAPFELVGEP